MVKTKIMKAEIKWGLIGLEGLLNGDGPLGPISILERKEIEGSQKDLVRCEAPVLLIPQSHLEQDGFIVVKFLRALEAHEGKLYGVYGPFQDYGDLRCHLLAPIVEASQRNLKVYDWRVDTWLTTNPALT